MNQNETFTTVTSFAIPLVVLGFVCSLVGGMMKAMAGSSSSPKQLVERSKFTKGAIPEEYGTCYEDAWRLLIKIEEGDLVHGSVESWGERIKHAWVELPTGFVWEPESGRFIRIDKFNAAFKPKEEVRYSAEEAAIMATRTGNLGPWTEEEKRQILRRQETIFFNVPEAREYLISHGIVYTLRQKSGPWERAIRRPVTDVAYYGSFYKKKGIGRVSIEFIGEIKDTKELLPYVARSGFAMVEDWWEAAEGSRFLFRVTKV